VASFLGGIARSWAGAGPGVKGFCSVCTHLARAPGRPWRGDRRVPPPSRAARRRRIPPPSRAARRRIGGGPAREGGLSPAPFPAPPLGGDGRGGAWGVGEARVRGGCWLPKPGERAGAPERGRAAARERRGGRGPRDATRPARPAGRCKGRRRGPARRARPKRAAGRTAPGGSGGGGGAGGDGGRRENRRAEGAPTRADAAARPIGPARPDVCWSGMGWVLTHGPSPGGGRSASARRAVRAGPRAGEPGAFRGEGPLERAGARRTAPGGGWWWLWL